MSTEAGSTTQPGYFGSADDMVFGAMHLPADRRIRAAVVLCGALAKEGYDTTRGMRLLADSLADRGFAVLRFDYRGTGESAGSQYAADAYAGWQRSISDAVGYVRELGVSDVIVVGLRIGALLACHNEDVRDTATGLVLWDPVVRGRQWVRAQAALHNISVGSASDDELVQLVGGALHRKAADQLSGLRIAPDLCAGFATTRPGKLPVLCAVRDTELDNNVISALRDAGSEVAAIGDPSAFVSSDTTLVELPRETVATIASWLDDNVATTRQRIEIPPLGSSATEAFTGGVITTTIHTLGDGTVLWDTTPRDTPIDQVERVLVIHSTANDTRIGPARLWVETARAVAAHGGRAVRYDRPGVGEASPINHHNDTARLYTAQSVASAFAVTDHARIPGATTVQAGICSGSWLAARAASDHSPLDELVMINPLLWRLRSTAADTDLAAVAALGQAAQAAPEVDTMTNLQYRLRSKLGARLRAGIPYPALTVLGRAKVLQAPQVLLNQLTARGVTPHLVFSPWDQERFAFNRGQTALAKLSARGLAPRVTVAPGGDHPALHWQMRHTAISVCWQALGWGRLDHFPVDEIGNQDAYEAVSDAIVGDA